MLFSFLIPTRNRIPDLLALLQSIVATTRHSEKLEVVLGIDQDDTATLGVQFEGLNIKKIVLVPGMTMGAMNNACYEASCGKYVMLLNDDMLLRTDGWDEILERHLALIEDEIFLVHVNDLLFGEKLCCFPMVSRAYCEIAGGICPDYYERYRIDDHIYQVFNLLGQAGYRRTYYFPDVVFEHLNFEATQSGNREYLYDKTILDRDAERFDEHLADRKSLALALASHIDDSAKRRSGNVRAQILERITSSAAARQPAGVRHVRTASDKASPGGTRVTIGVVCSDIRRPHTQTCINLIKAHTSNYELVVLDNSNDPNFNHPREMNRLLEFSRNRQVVLLDDDVFVEPGWLQDMQSALVGDVACVTPVHKDASGQLSYAGVYVGLDDNGDHAHLMDVPDKPILVPTICSAVMLVDMDRCGHLRFDEECLKYFHDLDFGLQVWAAGCKVACNTKVPVTHLGGATLKQGSQAAQAYVERDRQVFINKWIKSGQLESLRRGVWESTPDIEYIYALADRFGELLQAARVLEPDWQDRISRVVAEASSIRALRTSFLSLLRKSMFAQGTTLSSEIFAQLRWLHNLLKNHSAGDGQSAIIKEKIASLVASWTRDNKRIIVYPAGSYAGDLFRETCLLQANIVGFGDSNPMLAGDELWGKIVVSPTSLLALRPDVILIASKQFESDISNSLRPMLPPEVEIVRLFADA